MAKPDFDSLELNFGIQSAGFRQAQKEFKKLAREAAELEKKSSEAAKDQKAVAEANVKTKKEELKTAQTYLKTQEKAFNLAKRDMELAKNKLGLLQRAGMAGSRGVRGALGVARTGLGLAGSAAGGIAGLFLGAVQSAYQLHVQHKQTLGRSIGLLDPGEYRRAAYGSGGTRYGFSLTDVASMIPAMGRNTGTGNVRELMQGMRATGLGAGEVGAGYGMLTDTGGYSFASKRGGSEGSRQFVNMMALGVESGLKKAEFHKFLSGMSSVLRHSMTGAGGPLDATKIGSELSIWGKYGGKSFQGVYGAQKYQQLVQSIARPGGGEWGEALMMQSQGWGKPGGMTDYYTAMRNRQDPNMGPENIRKLMGEARSQYGVGQEANLALSNATGLSLPVIEKLQDIYNNGKDMAEKDEEIREVLEEAKSIEQQALEAMKGVGGTLSHIASQTNIGIKLGERVAPAVETIQKWITKNAVELVNWIIKYLPKIWAELNNIGDLFTWQLSKDEKAIKDFEKYTHQKSQAFSSKEEASAYYDKRIDLGNVLLSQAGKKLKKVSGVSASVFGALPFVGDSLSAEENSFAIQHDEIKKNLEAAKLAKAALQVGMSPEMAKIVERRGRVVQDKYKVNEAGQDLIRMQRTMVEGVSSQERLKETLADRENPYKTLPGRNDQGTSPAGISIDNKSLEVLKRIADNTDPNLRPTTQVNRINGAR